MNNSPSELYQFTLGAGGFATLHPDTCIASLTLTEWDGKMLEPRSVALSQKETASSELPSAFGLSWHSSKVRQDHQLHNVDKCMCRHNSKSLTFLKNQISVIICQSGRSETSWDFLPFPDPSWASVNRGTFICDECCSVHRSLGRHISQVRHLKHTPWPPTLLQVKRTSPVQGFGVDFRTCCFSN